MKVKTVGVALALVLACGQRGLGRCRCFDGLAINLVIELAVYRFGYGLKLGTRQVALITAANVITVGMALLSIAFIPSHLY